MGADGALLAAILFTQSSFYLLHCPFPARPVVCLHRCPGLDSYRHKQTRRVRQYHEHPYPLCYASSVLICTVVSPRLSFCYVAPLIPSPRYR